MEKVKHFVILIFLLIASSSSAQSWITGMTFDYSFNRQNWDSTKKHNIVLDFPSLSYDETFEVKLNNISSLSTFGGFKNHFVFNKNVIVADLSLGVNLYSYTFDISKKSGAITLDTTEVDFRRSDSTIWEDYLVDKEEIRLNRIYPSIRFNLGYQRQLVNFRNLALYVDAGILLERRFSFFQDNNKSIYDTRDTIFAHFGDALDHRRIIPSAYLGLSLRIGSNSLGLKLGSNLSSITRKEVNLEVNEVFAQVSYSKLFRETHIGREQIIYDEYQHISQTRASEYRRGDKFSYVQINFAHEERADYPSENEYTEWFLEGTDSIEVTKEGYHLQPNVGFDLMLNTFFTHRWMMGLGLSMYEESYSSYGTYMQNDIVSSFGDEVLRSEPDNSYQEYWSKTKVAVALNTAIYISKRTMIIDPYVKGAASMVMDYDRPNFLKDDPAWRSTSFFPIFKVGAGIDLRLRIKSSKFFVLGIGADYNINPHVNHIQYFVKIGYYRKKKLKNQTY